MPSKRKFHRNVIQVEILSEEPYDLDSKELEDIAADITTGNENGQIETIVQNEEVGAVRAAVILLESGSDPSFFGLTEEGEDIDPR